MGNCTKHGEPISDKLSPTKAGSIDGVSQTNDYGTHSTLKIESSMMNVGISLENFSLMTLIKEPNLLSEGKKGDMMGQVKGDMEPKVLPSLGKKRGRGKGLGKNPNMNNETEEGKKDFVERPEIKGVVTTNSPKHKQVRVWKRVARSNTIIIELPRHSRGGKRSMEMVAEGDSMEVEDEHLNKKNSPSKTSKD